MVVFNVYLLRTSRYPNASRLLKIDLYNSIYLSKECLLSLLSNELLTAIVSRAA